MELSPDSTLAIPVSDFHAELPREDCGEIFKRKLREPFWEGAGRRI